MSSPWKLPGAGLVGRYPSPVIAALGLAVASLLALAAYDHQREQRDAARAVARHAAADGALEVLRRSLTEQEVAIHEGIAALEAGAPAMGFERRYARARASFGTTLPKLRGHLRPATVDAIAAAYAQYAAASARVWSAVRARRRSAATRQERRVGEPRFEAVSELLRTHAERHYAATRSAAAAHARSEHRAVGATLLAAGVGVALLALLGALLLRAERGRARASVLASEGDALRAVLARFRSLIEGMPCVSYIADQGPAGRWHYVSPQIEGLLGYGAEEWMEDPALWLRSLHPDDADWVVAYEVEHWNADATDGVAAEYRMVARDGRTVWVNDAGMSFVGPDGTPAWYGVMFDVSARKAAEAELAQARAQLEEAQSLARLGSFEYCFKEGRVHGSREFAAITGLDPAAAPWPLNHLVRLLPEERRADALKAIKALAEGWPLEAEWPLTRADGSTRSVTVIARQTCDGGPPRAIGTIQDVTDLRNAERERSELQQALAHSQRLESVGKLAGGVAHEFNNLLTVIANSAAFLEEAGHGDGAGSQDLRYIRDACDRATTLTGQLLAFATKEMVREEQVDLGAFMADTAPLLQRALGERIAVVTAASDAPCVVSVDPAQMQQVLLNLALNARDAMPRGGMLAIELTRDVEAPSFGAAGREWVGLIVSDDGCGMEPAVAERAFDPFFTTKPRGTGTGLGLSMVHGIIRQFGGTVELESEPGRGTTFRILLPATDGAEPPRPPAESRRPQGLRAEPGAERTVLVVDDQESLRATVARMLERAGFEVLVARDGRDALEVLSNHPGEVDLVLSDVVMPYLDGRELAMAIGDEGPPVVFMSGYTDDPAVHELAEVHGVPVLRKPFTTRELIALVTRTLGASPRAPL